MCARGEVAVVVANDAEAFREMETAARRIAACIDGDIEERMTEDLYRNADEIAQTVVSRKTCGRRLEEKIDDIVLSRTFGYPLMLLLLGTVFWLTIVGANIPSSWLGEGANVLLSWLNALGRFCGVASWLQDMLIGGMLECLLWVVAVMLPPMMIFFVLFTLLEDVGYLPRIALQLDHLFYRSCACGKQALTMCMGFGCNAAGVVSCRIIDSPRERILAMVTNAFVPCNGRFPTILLLATLVVGTETVGGASLLIATIVTGIVLLGVIMTLIVTKWLACTLLRGEASTMILELPSYRMPNLGGVLYRSLWERVRVVLLRAIVVAMPAGLVIWLLAHTSIGEMSLLLWLAESLDPIAWYIGLDGAILLAFILGMPANEIVLPILLMIYLQAGQMTEIGSISEIGRILSAHGWGLLTVVNTAIFTLFHWPCATTLLSIWQESHSLKWTLMAFGLPTAIGAGLCLISATVMRVFGYV